ncbi:MAG: MmcQ/YjbR family DNA-binding protein [Saprospiraceae bacterium]|nr:MmcQ/YjbR family DNA-binding protein [Saprospiraceae bacterium]
MTAAEFKELALAFPGTEAAPHFDRTAFKVVKRRIFASLHEPSQSANICLTPTEQAEFCEVGGPGVFPIPNKWGQQGWTTFELKDVAEEVMQAAMEAAYGAAMVEKGKK